MVETHTNSAPDRRELRNFGLVFSGGLIFFFGLVLPWIFERPWPLWPWVGAGLFSGAGLVIPGVLRPVHYVWLKLGHVLGWINTRIILGLVFFVMFAPVALALRIFGKDPLHRKLDRQAETYRIVSEKLPRERMEKPF
ncbi:MAG TPA: SxtJ family membrane protein [Gammaproteobacteria bacterium]|nr:SxtJ family membrane protein [Gammaproteobacteria bacterium]